MNKTSKRALVTGASSGIGQAISKELIEQGYAVTGVGRDFSESEIDVDHQWCLELADLSTLEQALKDHNQEYDLLVLSAGYGDFGGVEQFSYEQISSLINVNLIANLYFCKRYLPAMKQKKYGDIVIIGSESAMAGARAGSVYCASKFALRGFSQSLRADCRNANIRVMLCNPGPVDTPFFDELDFAPLSGREFSLDAQDIAQAISAALNQARHVVVEEIQIQPLKRSFSKT